eukprot:Selendium_serpulae@DN6152_c0_g1_i2.p1
MGRSNSKQEARPEDIEQFLRTANHEQLVEAIMSKTATGDKRISKVEANKVLAVQKTQLKEMIEALVLQMRKDELAAHRFVALKKQELACVALKKRVQHSKMLEEIECQSTKHEGLQKQIRENKLEESITKSIMRASTIIRDANEELSNDYIRQIRRPNFNIQTLNAQFEILGIDDSDVMGDVNALWMADVENSLAQNEELLERWDTMTETASGK